ncbi:MAG: DUF3025 domain-containing protein [Betaproteobacteria bacterium]|nr:DUF3025 domain-containing protein [Betaproteobacteria bacterium]
MSASRTWDSEFLSRSAAFEVLRGVVRDLDLSAWPPAAALTHQAKRLAPPGAKPISFVETDFVGTEPVDALSYEERIYRRGEVLCRPEDWHDFLNALVWMAFPEAKAALNARHIAELAKEAPGQRGRARDALTLFDEGGAIVCSTDSRMLGLIRAFQWKELFWRQRERFQASTRVFIFGHAMYHKLLDPFLGVSALALLHEVPNEFLALPLEGQLLHAGSATAERLEDASTLATPRDLAPFPVLGVPGWFAANHEEYFYDNQNYFRPGRMRAARAAEAIQSRHS